MEQSEKFDMVKKYYCFDVWDETRVRNAVIKEWITIEEYEIITGQTY